MVKIKGPLLSLEAHGSLSDIITYSKRRSGSQCRKYNKPTLPASAAQRGQRRLTEFLIAQWQNMTAGDKATWETNAKASPYRLSGYHYFLRQAQRDLYTHHGLCGYWSCNEIDAGKIRDISGQSNEGTLKPTYPSDAPLLVTSKSARFSNALKYDGVNDYVECAYNATFDIAGVMSIEALIKANDVTGQKGIVFKGGAGVDQRYKLMTETKKLYFERQTLPGYSYVKADIDTPIDTWLHIDCTYDDSHMRIFMNGVEIKAKDVGSNTVPFINQPLAFGNDKYAGGRFWDGIIDEVCLYNRALSANEIATRYKFATAKV